MNPSAKECALAIIACSGLIWGLWEVMFGGGV